MSYENPNVILIDSSGNTIPVQNGVAIPASTPALLLAGSDGTNSRYILIDSSGRQVLVGAGTAGTPSGGVVSIQGVAGGVTVPVSGTVTATNPSVSTTGIAPPGSATYIGGSVTTSAPSYTTGQMSALSLGLDGSLRITSKDNIISSGTFTATAQTQAYQISSGSSSISLQFTGTWTGTINFEKSIDGTNWVAMSYFTGTNSAVSTTVNGIFFSSLGSTQWIKIRTSATWTGTAAWNVSTSVGIKAVVIHDSLPTGANVIGAVTGSGTFTVNASATVGLVDNAAFVDGTTRVQPIGYILDETAGTALTENDAAAARIDSKRAQVITIEDATTRGQRLNITAANAMKVDGSAVTQPISGTITANAGTGTFIVDGSAVTQPVSVTTLPLPTGAATESTLAAMLTLSGFQARINTLGQKTMANSTPVVLSSDQSAIPVSQSGSWTVTANAGSGNFSVAQATASNLRAQTSSESNTGATSPTQASLTGGSVTTVSPTYTTGQMNALSLTTTGSLRIDGSGSTQPISGTVTANQGGTWNITNISGTVSLPTGAATETTLSTISGKLPAALVGGRLDSNIGAWLGSTAPTVGSKTSANSIPVVIASDQGTVTVNASATVGIVDNAAFTDGTTRIQPSGYIFDEVAGTALIENNGAAARVDSKRAQILVIEDATTRGTRTTVKAASTAAVAADPALVVAISPNNTLPTKEVRSATPTVTSVAGNTSSVTVLAANANRLGATIQNNTSKTLYLKFGSTASTSSHTVVIVKDAYYEVPFNYTGLLSGIWDSGVSGNALITEIV